MPEDAASTPPNSDAKLKIRAYHEAGHVLMALHLGVKVKDAWCSIEHGSRVNYDPATHNAASEGDRALLALAGGAAEEMVFGERSPDCCTDDLKRVSAFLELQPAGDRPKLQAELEAQVRASLSRAEFRSALDVLAYELSEESYLWGACAPLLKRKCPNVVQFLPALQSWAPSRTEEVVIGDEQVALARREVEALCDAVTAAVQSQGFQTAREPVGDADPRCYVFAHDRSHTLLLAWMQQYGNVLTNAILHVKVFQGRLDPSGREVQPAPEELEYLGREYTFDPSSGAAPWRASNDQLIGTVALANTAVDALMIAVRTA